MAEGLRERAAARARGTNGGERAPAQPPARLAPAAQVAEDTRALTEAIRSMEREYTHALPAGADVQQVIRDAVTAVRQVPRLRQCDELSVLGAVMTAAQLGLRIGVLGHCWVLPYRNQRESNRQQRPVFQAQFVLGYQGLVDLAYRTDRVSMIAARTIHQRDEFDLAYGGRDDLFIHRPYRGPEGRGRAESYYAQARTTNGGYMIAEPWSEAEMIVFRDRFAAQRDDHGNVTGPWIQYPVPMRHKTMVKQLGRLLPKSPDLANALAADESVRTDPDPNLAPGEASEPITPHGETIPGEVVDRSGDGGTPGPAQ